MLEGKGNIRKWGNSFAIRVPIERLKQEGIKLNDEVVFIINKKATRVRDIFGKLKFKTKTEKLLEQINKDFWQ